MAKFKSDDIRKREWLDSTPPKYALLFCRESSPNGLVMNKSSQVFLFQTDSLKLRKKKQEKEREKRMERMHLERFERMPSMSVLN